MYGNIFGNKLLEEGQRELFQTVVTVRHLPSFCIVGPFAMPCALGFPVGIRLVYFDYWCAEFSKAVLVDEVKMLERAAGRSYLEKKNLRQKTFVFFTYLYFTQYMWACSFCVQLLCESKCSFHSYLPPFPSSPSIFLLNWLFLCSLKLN